MCGLIILLYLNVAYAFYKNLKYIAISGKLNNIQVYNSIQCKPVKLRKFNFMSKVRDMTSWGITNLKSYRIEQSDSFTIAVHVDESEYYYPDDALYWVAPATYLRNKVS